MARLLVQLKLRLLANALRSSNRAKASFMVSTAFAVLTALGMFALLASLHGQGTAVSLTTFMFTVFAFGWLILPLLAFGLDSTLDPATMALYPLRTRPLATGLLAASATGAWPAANVIGLLGVLIGLAHGALGRAHRPGRGTAAGAVLHRAGPVRDHQHGRAAALPPRQGPGRLPVHPDHRRLRVLHPGGAEAGRQREADHHKLRRLRRVAALAAAGPGRARDPGRLGRAPRHRRAAPGAAGRRHPRARLAVDPLAEPRPGIPRLLHPVIPGPGHGTALRPLRTARRGGRPILDLPAP